MKKYLFMAATAALALSSCSSDELVQGPEVEEGGVPVAFDSYMLRSRATILTDVESAPGSTTAHGIKHYGFGVFAYEQGTLPVETYTNSLVTPNFFNNEQIAWSTGLDRWAYGKDLFSTATSGVKYWPNNPGAMLSFYAYAPYMKELPTDPIVEGCRLVLSGANNGPAIQYIMPKNLANAVDLCWGQEYGKELSPVNKTKPSVTENIHFNFKHAMARYGFNVQVWNDALTDNYPGTTQHDPSGAQNQALKDGTIIKIESVKLIGTFAKEGVLRLYDGTWDAEIATTSTYELQPSFNPAVDAITTTIAKEEIPLLTDKDTYVMMIPGARFKIQITYTVTTVDDKINGGSGSKVTNVLESPMYTAIQGVATDFHLNLGMTTVKFDATVTPWNKEADKIEVDLPANSYEIVNAHTVTGFTSLAEKFLGFSSVVPTATAEGQYYFDNKNGMLKGWDGSNWGEANKSNCYYVNPQLIEYKSEKWEVMPASPKWILNSGVYYMLTPAGTYVTVKDNTSGTPYADLQTLAAANPGETKGVGELYKIGTDTVVYYVKQ